MAASRDTSAPPQDDDMQLAPREKVSSAQARAILKMESVHLDYDDRDKGDYEPAPKGTRRDRAAGDIDMSYDERRKTPPPRRDSHANARRRSRSRSWSRSRSRSRSRPRRHDRNHHRSRSPDRYPRRHRYSGRSRSRIRDYSRSRSRTRRHERSPRGSRRDDNARWDSRPRPSGRNGGGTRPPQPVPPDVARAKQNIAVEERKRGQRLFGGLLANLGGAAKPRRAPGGRAAAATAATAATATTPATADDSRKTADRLAKLDRIRRIEQVRIDEKVMNSTLANDLALAHNLRTKSQPQLYYRPRVLSSAQEKTIADQIRDAEHRAEQKRQAFASEKQTRLAALGAQSTVTDMTTAVVPQAQHDEPMAEGQADAAPPLEPDAMVDEPRAEQVDDKLTLQGGLGAQTDGQDDRRDLEGAHDRTRPTSGLHEDHDERDKYIMVETEEDTVIY